MREECAELARRVKEANEVMMMFHSTARIHPARQFTDAQTIKILLFYLPVSTLTGQCLSCVNGRSAGEERYGKQDGSRAPGYEDTSHHQP